MAKHAGGRPAIFTKDFLDDLAIKFRIYIDDTPIPIIAEFAYMNNVERQTLYENDQFTTLLKHCIAKKEAQLEKGALANKLNPAMSIFSLKQLGWSDKQSVDVKAEINDAELVEKINELLGQNNDRPKLT